MADLKKLEEDAVSFAQQAISLDQQGLCEMAFFYYCVSMVIVVHSELQKHNFTVYKMFDFCLSIICHCWLVIYVVIYINT